MANISRDPFEDFFRGFFVRPVEFGSPTESQATFRIDVAEMGDSYIVRAELPGVRKEDIHVNIDGPVVAVNAERRAEVREGERILRNERHIGKLVRSFQLGQEIDDSRAAAKYVDGVLELTLPKRAAASAKRLAID